MRLPLKYRLALTALLTGMGAIAVLYRVEDPFLRRTPWQP